MISHETMLWVVFGAVILILFALDLGVFHKKSHEVGIKEALTWSGIWLTTSDTNAQKSMSALRNGDSVAVTGTPCST